MGEEEEWEEEKPGGGRGVLHIPSFPFPPICSLLTFPHFLSFIPIYPSDLQAVAAARERVHRLLEEYHGLDYEDDIGGTKTRFRLV
jgi:hypothetical protein